MYKVSLTVLYLIFLLCVIRWFHYADDDRTLPNSLVGMEELLELERLLISNLEEYADELQMKLDVVRRATNDMRKENARSGDDAEKYLANPLNSFSLIRRMREDWLKWEMYMKKPVAEDQLKALRQFRHNLPSADDLKEAISGIIRIQTTYDLEASDMAKGLLYNKQYESTLSVMDCAAIGFELFDRGNYEYATYWLQVALELYDKSEPNEILQLERITLLEMYLDSLLKQMRTKDALRAAEAALQKQPTNTLLLMKRADIQMLIKSMNSSPVTRSQRVPDPYERGCQGEFANKISNLHCSYNSSTTAFLKLAPLKMEVLHLDPYIALYHDVISDEEIRLLKELARPILEPATVCPCLKASKETLRSAKIAWLSDENVEPVSRINQRIGDMTGLDMRNSEELQVSSYGLGGHFTPHRDYFGNDEDNSVLKYGDRLCTVVIYLSDVEQGGLTVFPLLNTSVYARKGTAIMWYNLNNRVERDLNTIHGGCPVLVGSKWGMLKDKLNVYRFSYPNLVLVATKWIRSRDQEFRKPCYKE